MRKILLFSVALMMAVAANAFNVRMQNFSVSDPFDKNWNTTTATPNADVFGDDKVSIEFDEAAKTVIVRLKDGAKLWTENGQSVFEFVGDDSYPVLNLVIEGKAAIEGGTGSAIDVEKAKLCIVSDNPDAKLDVKAKSHVLRLQTNGKVEVGNGAKDPFAVNFLSETTSDLAVFLGAGGSGTSLRFLYANVTITAPATTRLTQDLKWLSAISKLSDGEIYDDKDFYKDGNPYKGNMTLAAPYLITVQGEYLFPGDEANFKPTALKGGKISFNKETKTITLEDAEIDGYLWIGYPDATVFLKGDNYLRNTAAFGDTRLQFEGKNGKIAGEEDAWLTIYGNNVADGIFAKEGLVIDDFNQLYMMGVYRGIVGGFSDSENDFCLLKKTPVTIYSSGSAICDFRDFTIENADLKLPTSVQGYSTSIRALVDFGEGIVTDVVISYPTYFTFYDKSVTARNAADIIKETGVSGKASYDHASATLTLNGFKYEGYDPSQGIYANNNMTIKLVGENIITGSTNAIESSFDLTIEGLGSLKAEGLTGTNGILLASTSTLTISGGATVEVIGYSAIRTDAMMDCSGMDPEPTGDAATLVVNNSTLKMTADGSSDSYNGALVGFKKINLTDAKLSEPEGAITVPICDGIDAKAGITKDGAYVKAATIVKTGASAVEKVATENPNAVKVLRNEQLLIIRDGKAYNVQGALVER